MQSSEVVRMYANGCGYKIIWTKTPSGCAFLSATGRPQPKDGVERNEEVIRIRSDYIICKCYDRADLASYDYIAGGISAG
ncbi:hypothetical protein PV325_008734, partial [Microctonus aethiopoides]